MRGISPPALFELRAHWWPSAKAGGMPWTRTTLSFQRAHCLANRPGTLVRLTFQIGPRGRTCTCNLSVLSGTPLHWATRGCCTRTIGAHGRDCTDTRRVLSALPLRWAMWAKLVPREGFAPSTFTRYQLRPHSPTQ